MKVFISIVLVLSLAGCGSMGSMKTDAQYISAACATASASLKVLTIANMEHRLSKQAQLEVSSAVGLISPVCSADHAPNLTDVQEQAFKAGLALIAAHAKRVGE